MKKINRGNFFGFYFYQKRSLFTDLRSITWFFKTSFKLTYFNTVFMIFLGRYQSKKMWKQHFSTKLDKVYRVVYELSYLVKKKILTFFFGKGPSCWTKCTKFFSQQDLTIHTSIESPDWVDEKYSVSKYFLSDFWLKKP